MSNKHKYKITQKKTIEEAKAQINAFLQNKKVDFVKTTWENDTLVVDIKKMMGKSKIVVALYQKEEILYLEEKERHISPVHAPFVGMVDAKVRDLLEHLQAEPTDT